MSRAVVREGAGLLAAVLLGVIAVATISLGDRAWMLLYDGDSVLPLLMQASLAAGEPQQWQLSTVLFVPELALSTPILALVDALGGSGSAGLLIAAVANVVLLYAAVRILTRALRTAPGWGALGAAASTALYCLLALLDHRESRDGLELASLFLTQTYYSATTVAAILLTAGVVATVGRERGRRAWLAPTATFTVMTVSTFSNPIVIAWALVPLSVTGAALVLTRRVALLPASVAAAALVGGALLGWMARIPAAGIIGDDLGGKFRPHEAPLSVGLYTRLLGEHVADARGAASLALVALLLGAAAVATFVLRRDAGHTPALLVAASGWVAPLLVVVGALLLGTDAPRYLQPVVSAPIVAAGALLATLAPRRVAARAARTARSARPASATRAPATTTGAAAAASASLAALAVLAAALALPASQNVSTADADAACVVDEIEAGEDSGAGPFWAARGVKARLEHPARLVQTDAAFEPYYWLANRADAAVGSVTFAVTEVGTRLLVPSGVVEDRVVACGRYDLTYYSDGIELR